VVPARLRAAAYDEAFPYPHPPASRRPSQKLDHMAQWAAWVAKHGRVLAGLLHKMNRLVTISVEGNEQCLREVLAHALSLLPRCPRLTGISRVWSDAPAQPLKPFPFLEGLAEGLALTLAQGRLCHLHQLDLSRYGFWRFLRHTAFSRCQRLYSTILHLYFAVRASRTHYHIAQGSLNDPHEKRN
jgi:hypothetical protein